MSATAAGSGDQRTALRWDYSPAPEATDHVRLRDRYGLFVDGEFVEPAEGGYAPTINPATEEPLVELLIADKGADWAMEGQGKANEAADAATPRTTFLRVIRRSASMRHIQ